MTTRRAKPGCIHEGDRQRVAVVDDGRIYRSTSGLKQHTKRLATLQKLVSNRRVRGTTKHADPTSKRTARRRKTIARLHQRIAQQREHTLQYIARRLVDTAATTVFEAIAWHRLRRRSKGQRRRGLNRALGTASPGRLVALTTEKAQAEGVGPTRSIHAPPHSSVARAEMAENASTCVCAAGSAACAVRGMTAM